MITLDDHHGREPAPRFGSVIRRETFTRAELRAMGYESPDAAKKRQQEQDAVKAFWDDIRARDEQRKRAALVGLDTPISGADARRRVLRQYFADGDEIADFGTALTGMILATHDLDNDGA